MPIIDEQDELDRILGGSAKPSAPTSAPLDSEMAEIDRVMKAPAPAVPNPSSVTPTAVSTKPSPPAAAAMPQAAPPEKSVRLRPDMTDDDLITSFGYDPATIKRSSFYKPNMLSESLTHPKGVLGDLADSWVGGAVRGAKDVADSISQLSARAAEKLGAVDPSTVALVDLVAKVAEADYQQNWRKDTMSDSLDVGRMAGSVAVPLPGTGALTKGATLVNTLKALAAGGTGAALGSRVTDTTTAPGGQGDDFWSRKAAQVGLGAGLGVAGQKLASAFGKGAAKIANARRGVVAPAMAEAAAVEKLAQREGVRTSFGDISREKYAQTADTMGESVPGIGMEGFRKKQQAELADAALRRGDRLETAAQAEDFAGLQTLRDAAAKGDKRAIELLDEIAAMPVDSDWMTIMKASGEVAPLRRKLLAGKLYDRVAEAAKGQEIVPARTVSLLDEEIARLSADKVRDEPTLRYLTKLRESFGDDAPESFEVMRRLRSRVGNDAKQPPGTVVGTEGRAILSRLRAAVDDDVRTSIAESGNEQLQKAWKKADTFYKTAVVPYKDRQLAKALSGTNKDEMFDAMIQRGKGERARKFYDALDKKGRAAVRFGFIERAMDKATNKETGNFSPQKFANEFARLRTPYEEFFKGMDRAEMDGFTKLMAHTARAGQFRENNANGMRIIPWLLAGGSSVAAMTNPGSVAAGAALIAGARALFTSNAGKKFLLAASDLSATSPKMDALIQKFVSQSPRVAGQAGSRWAQSKESR